MNQKQIIEKYPLLFARYYLPMNQTSMCWGLQIGTGWLPIIDDLCAKIQKLVDDKCIESFQFESIKEKYGSLRIQSHRHYKETEALIRQASNKASDTCERCSATIIYNYNSDDSDSDENNNNYDRLCKNCK